MNTILVSHKVLDRYGDLLHKGLGDASQLSYYVWDDGSPDPRAERDQIQAAYLSPDIMGASPETKSASAFESFSTQIREAPALRWLHLCTAGADGPMFREFVRRGVTVTTSSGANARPVAHTALAALSYFARGLPHWQAAQRAHEWKPVRWEHGLPALHGSTVTVVGMGPIGREICRLCRVIGLHVIGIRRRAEQLVECDETRTYDELDEVLPRTCWLILACPLTDTTRHLINLSRGEVAVDDAIRTRFPPARWQAPSWMCSSRSRCRVSRRFGTRQTWLSLRTVRVWLRVLRIALQRYLPTMWPAGLPVCHCVTRSAVNNG